MFRLDLGKYSTKGGFLSPTLAAILYQTSLGDFVYQTDSNGNVVLDNQGTLTSTNDGLPYSGRGIELGALNDVEFPIHHTLGSEQLINGTFDTDITGWIAYGAGASVAWDTDNGGSILLTVSASGDGIRQNGTLLSGTNLVSFKVKSSALRTLQYYNGASFVAFPEQPSAIGVYETLTGEVTISSTTNFIIRASNGVAADTFYFDDITSKQITNPNSYVSYYDLTLGEFVTLNMAEV